MCGIAGLVSSKLDSTELQSALVGMTTRLAHRGPDDQGSWINSELGVALGHRRLSILDLSPEGHQPMLSPSHRYVMVFNGEVYNFREIQTQLQNKGYSFRGSSDTEVMLAAIEAWGLTAAIQKFNGMFAFVVWDQQDRKLHLVRDRLGIKPLYYGWTEAGFVFASELKAIASTPKFSNQVDRDSICQFMRHSCIAAPRSIYKSIFKLEQACYFTFSYEELLEGREDFAASSLDLETPFKPIQYWSARQVAEAGQRTPLSNEPDTINKLHDLLKDAVKLRMISDVPIGAFLSGGIDSSLVAALMQSQSSQPIRTFSIGFAESAFDESAHAKQVAAHLGCTHTELRVTAKDALDAVPSISQIFDEPFADSSQIPTLLLSQLTRRHVTVALSGDGGDELFAGYERYRWASKIAKFLNFTPALLRHLLSRAISCRSRAQWEKFWQCIFSISPNNFRFAMPGDKMQKLGRVLQYSNSASLYGQMISHWTDPASLVLNSSYPSIPFLEARSAPGLTDSIHMMMYMDLMFYLPDDVMVKVDRASMAASLEAREPLLDYRLAEFAWSLPLQMKLRSGVSKWALRQILYRYVPSTLVDRPKMGFGVPIDSWLRGPLREWAEDLLDVNTINNQGYLNSKLVQQAWNQFIGGQASNHYLIWDVLMFQAWIKEHLKSK